MVFMLRAHSLEFGKSANAWFVARGRIERICILFVSILLVVYCVCIYIYTHIIYIYIYSI